MSGRAEKMESTAGTHPVPRQGIDADQPDRCQLSSQYPRGIRSAYLRKQRADLLCHEGTAVSSRCGFPPLSYRARQILRQAAEGSRRPHYPTDRKQIPPPAQVLAGVYTGTVREGRLTAIARGL